MTDVAGGTVIETLEAPVAPADIRDLGALLIDAVESNAGISFMPPLSPEVAEQFWLDTIARLDRRGAIFVARDEQGIAGTVQLHPSWAPNQPHRADVAKLIVHRRARGRGLASALMAALEARARENGLTLLTLDTVRGDAAEQLYRRAGWIEAGVIPNYALNPDGFYRDTVIFYKEL